MFGARLDLMIMSQGPHILPSLPKMANVSLIGRRPTADRPNAVMSASTVTGVPMPRSNDSSGAPPSKYVSSTAK